MSESQCLRCGQPWEEGFVVAGRGIGWRRRPPGILGFLRVEWLAGGWLAPATMPAKRCRRCALVLAEGEATLPGQYERTWI